MRKLLIVLLSLLAILCTHRSLANDRLTELEEKLNLSIVTDTVITGSWGTLQYDLPSDTALLHQYLQLLDQEYSKYPKGYFNVIGIRQLVLAQNLSIMGQHRAAIPDPYKGILFLAIDVSPESENYLIHVMHHELHHCTEYYYWNNMNYEWEEWTEANSQGFQYKGGGSFAYDQPDVDWNTFSNPEEGFLNLYSTTAQEEDRSEIVAAIMGDENRKILSELLENDRILQQKVLLIKILLSEVSKTENNYWNRVFSW